MSEKAKVDKPGKPRINRYSFLGLWVAAFLLGWLSYFIIGYQPNNNLIGGAIVGLIIGIPTASVQKLSLYLHFGRVFRWWIRLNVLAWILGGMSITFVMKSGVDGETQFLLMLQVLSLMLIPSLAQAWILRKHVQHVWLWILSAIAGSSVFAGILGQFGNNEIVAFLAFGTYAVVMALTLLWLFGMQSKENKLKNIQDTSRLTDETEDESDSVELGETVQRKVV
jgi:hypothetical protein